MTTKTSTARKPQPVTEPEKLTNLRPFLVKGAKEEGARVMLDIDALPPSVQTHVAKFYHQLNVAMKDFGAAGLRVGEVLLEARTMLKPLGVWINFLNRVPGLSLKTGDRFIKRFEMAKRMLPGPVLSIAQTTGIDIAGEDEKRPFGKYTKAVQKIGNPPRPTGNVDKDTERARVWLSQVLVKQTSEVKRARAAAAEIDPTEKASVALIRAIEAYADKKETQIVFLKKVLKRTLKQLGYADLIVSQGALRRAQHADGPKAA